MTDAEWQRQREADAEIVRLKSQVDALRARVRQAEAAVKAADSARDVALRVAADPWRRIAKT